MLPDNSADGGEPHDSSPTSYEINVSEAISQFKDWLESDEGIQHRQNIADEKADVKKLMLDLTNMDKNGKQFTDTVLFGLLPYHDTKFAMRVSTFPVFMNIKTFFKNYGYSDADWNHIANMIFTLARGFEADPENLGRYIKEFTADRIRSRNLQCASISPILFCINESFPLINNRIIKTYREFADWQGWDDNISQKLDDYVGNIPKCQKLMDLMGSDAMPDFETFDLFCWWYDAIRGQEEAPDDAGEDYGGISSKKPREVDLKEFVVELDLDGVAKMTHYRLPSPDKKSIRELLGHCEKGEWKLPYFQRYFVWDKAAIRDLLDSIFNGFYIGSILLWTLDGDAPLELIPISGTEPKSKEPSRMIILDGQQRITAMYCAIRGKVPRDTKAFKNPAWFYIDFQRYLGGHRDENIVIIEQKLTWDESLKSLMFPLYELERHQDWMRDLRNMARDDGNISSKTLDVCDMLSEKLRRVIDGFEVPYVELPSSMGFPQVADIFEKINTTGKRLSVFDILIATLSKHGIKLRALWEDALRKHPKFKDYNSVDKMPIYILQSMALSHHGLSLCGREDQLRIYGDVMTPKGLDFNQVWRETADWVARAIDMLENPNDGFGVAGRKYLPYMPTIPILASLLRNVDSRSNKNACYDKIRTWYWSSVFSQEYSSGVDSQLTADYRAMTGSTDESGNPVPGWFDDDSRLPKAVEAFRVGSQAIRLGDVTKGAVFNGVLSLLALEGAQDFNTGRHSSNESNDKHHIFPRAGFSGRGRNVNSVLNMTWLSRETNRKIISDERPSVYMGRILEDNFGGDRDALQDKILDRHLISGRALECMLDDDFDGFMREREKEILEKIHKAVGVPGDASPTSTLIEPDKPFSNESAILGTIRECRGHIYWFDKYFGRNGLEWIATAMQEGNVKSIKILTTRSRPTLEKTEQLRDAFKKFRKEMKGMGVEAELRIIVESKVEASIHDRWIITEGTAYSIPSTDTIARGQASGITRDVARPDFEAWWEDSLDIFDDWRKILES